MLSLETDTEGKKEHESLLRERKHIERKLVKTELWGKKEKGPRKNKEILLY